MEEPMKMTFGWRGATRRISDMLSEGRTINPDGGTPAFCYEPGSASLLSLEVRKLRIIEGVVQAYLTEKGKAFDESEADSSGTRNRGVPGWHALDTRFLGLLSPTLESIEESLERDRYWRKATIRK
jgi:hypothetical protein